MPLEATQTSCGLKSNFLWDLVPRSLLEDYQCFVDCTAPIFRVNKNTKQTE
jgi:hypothetical protein